MTVRDSSNIVVVISRLGRHAGFERHVRPNPVILMMISTKRVLVIPAWIGLQ